MIEKLKNWIRLLKLYNFLLLLFALPSFNMFTLALLEFNCLPSMAAGWGGGGASRVGLNSQVYCVWKCSSRVIWGCRGGERERGEGEGRWVR